MFAVRFLVFSVLLKQMMLRNTNVYLYYSIQQYFWVFFGAESCLFFMSSFNVLLFDICFIKHIYFKWCVFIYLFIMMNSDEMCWPKGAAAAHAAVSYEQLQVQIQVFLFSFVILFLVS